MGNPKISEETTIVQNPDGSQTKTIVTTTTETKANGIVSTKTRTQVITEGIPIPPSKQNYKKGDILTLDQAAQLRLKAKRVKNTTCPKFKQEVLLTHNKLREIHGVSSLILDEDMGQVAQQWANCLAKIIGRMVHSEYGFGENLFWTNATSLTGQHVVEGWYSEIKDFNWDKIDKTPNTGHLTQLLWKDSTQLGVAMAEGKTGIYVVCNYNPPGNVVGQYPDNIFPANEL